MAGIEEKAVDGKLLPWFVLKSVSGIGNRLFKRLIDDFGSPQAVLAASAKQLLQVQGITARLAAGIRAQRITDPIKREVDLVQGAGVRIVTLADPDYPALLLQIPDPPPFLYLRGSLEKKAGCVAVVGSRNATSYGLQAARLLSSELAGRGITVVSGMARGIDTAAHQGALEAKGRTIAVLGSGLARVYPASNRKLFDRIACEGAVISEFAMLTDPEPHNFPMRNRIISGLSLGTLVVEAGRKSGSLITARLAAEQNREVFAVPGSIRSFKSSGTHTLIKQGAKLVENTADILEEIRHRLHFPAADAPETETRQASSGNLTPDERRLLDALSPYPLHIDDLTRCVGMESGKVASTLLQLELKGLVQQSAGKRFALCGG
ncbi:MAG: hypothetical protein AMJ54_11375 [Deltaproteobacteria bacterium SG8_13]|nr:MAG: hypothetical protein AMJ54_11375 [Deltaproteobacteria bacterium SG8_13]